MTSAADTPILPAHIETTIQAIARLHAEHHEGATPLERILERTTALAAQPGFVGLLAALVIGWTLLNVGLEAAGRAALDKPPFFWMQGFIALAALCMTTLILITQRRDDKLTSLREQLSLELAILSEQKSAKIIQLLEEMRRDDPHIHDREDHEAAAMSAPSDPQTVLGAIRDTQEGRRPVAEMSPSERP